MAGGNESCSGTKVQGGGLANVADDDISPEVSASAVASKSSASANREKYQKAMSATLDQMRPIPMAASGSVVNDKENFRKGRKNPTAQHTVTTSHKNKILNIRVAYHIYIYIN